jgi:adenylate cyclase
MEGSDLRHRLLAILAADAVGYSRLMSIDDRGTVRAIEAARSVFREQTLGSGGRVIDTAGDSVLAVFDTAAGAVTAALGVQLSLSSAAAELPEDRRMLFRIGVHLGDVIEKADGTVYGDGVNIAARLQSLADPGGTTVSDSIRTAVKGKVDADFDDQGDQQVKNIADPVRMFKVIVRGAGELTVPQGGGTASQNTSGEIVLTLPDKPSIAVLAFANMSGDADQEYFTDGISEDIITELSRFDSLFVIARNSSFTYKGRAVDVKQIGRELGVRYVVEGSIRRAGTRIRVTAQLIDALSGRHLWAERYDREAQDIFAVQEEVTECIVASIAPQVDVAEAMRTRRRPGNLSAYEVAVRAAGMLIEASQKSDRALANECLCLARTALSMDAESLLALNLVAYAQFQNLLLRSAPDRVQAWQEGMDAAMRGIALAQSSLSHALKGLLLAHEPTGGKLEEALISAETAYRLNPQDSSVIFIYAQLLIFAEEPVRAIELLKRALRINPRDPMVYNTYSGLAQAYVIARDYAGGVEWAVRARTAAPGYVHGHLLMAMLQAGLADLAKAQAALDEARRLAPELVQRRLATKSSSVGKNTGHQFDALLRIAAGLEDPGEMAAWR